MSFARHGVRVKEIVLPDFQFLALAHACKIHEPDAPRRAYLESFSNRVTEVRVGDSFKIAGPNGYVLIRKEVKEPEKSR